MPIRGFFERCIFEMNNLLKKIILFTGFFFVLSVAFAQGGKAGMDEVLNAIKHNHIQEIGKYLDNFVPITIGNNQANYSHNQAQLVLNDFFSKNPPHDFVVMNTGTPNPTSRFTIADFATPNGKFNIYILTRQKDNSYVVKEIRISKE
jgi:hypothetical protein